MSVEVNYVAVVLAMISSMAVGSIWYAQSVFGKKWAELAKVNMSRGGSIAGPMATTVLMSLITAYVLAHVAYLANHFFHHSFLQDSISTAFWLWLGLTAARFVTHDAFEGRPNRLTLLNIGNEFLTIMIMGLVIGLVGI